MKHLLISISVAASLLLSPCAAESRELSTRPLTGYDILVMQRTHTEYTRTEMPYILDHIALNTGADRFCTVATNTNTISSRELTVRGYLSSFVSDNFGIDRQNSLILSEALLSACEARQYMPGFGWGEPIYWSNFRG